MTNIKGSNNYRTKVHKYNKVIRHIISLKKVLMEIIIMFKQQILKLKHNIMISHYQYNIQ